MFSNRPNTWPRWLRSLTSLLGLVAPASAADHLALIPPPIPPATAHLALPPPIPQVVASTPAEASVDLAPIAPAPRTFDFDAARSYQFAARLAVVAKLNVASSRKPKRRSRPAPAGRQFPMAKKTSNVVARRPARRTLAPLAVRTPVVPVLLSKPQPKPSAEVIVFQVARDPAQIAFIAKRAA